MPFATNETTRIRELEAALRSARQQVTRAYEGGLIDRAGRDQALAEITPASERVTNTRVTIELDVRGDLGPAQGRINGAVEEALTAAARLANVEVVRGSVNVRF